MCRAGRKILGSMVLGGCIFHICLEAAWLHWPSTIGLISWMHFLSLPNRGVRPGARCMENASVKILTGVNIVFVSVSVVFTHVRLLQWSRLSRDCSETVQTVQTVQTAQRLSRDCPDCPETVQTVLTVQTIQICPDCSLYYQSNIMSIELHTTNPCLPHR